MFEGIKASLNECFESVKAAVSEKIDEAEAAIDEALPDFKEISVFSNESNSTQDIASDSFNSQTETQDVYDYAMSLGMSKAEASPKDYATDVPEVSSSPITDNEETYNNEEKSLSLKNKSIIKGNKQTQPEIMMSSELEAEQKRIEAQKEAGGIIDSVSALFGFGTSAQQRALDDKKELLQKAVSTGEQKDLREAYMAIYGENEAFIDSTGTITDISNLTSDEVKNLRSIRISDLSKDNLDKLMKLEENKSKENAKNYDLINSGEIECNGNKVSISQLNDILKNQFDKTGEDLKTSSERQGILSKAIGFVNNGLGIGTSKSEAQAQIDLYRELAEDLNNCKTPEEYAVKFKQLTGQDFNTETIVKLLAYNQINNNEADTEKINSDENDLGSAAKELVDLVNKDYKGQKDILSLTNNSKAKEALEDYKTSRKEVKDGVVGLVSGLAADVTVGLYTTAGVCAAPFTGGASLGLVALGMGIGGGVGAGVSTGLNLIDSVYDSDGDGSSDFNYSAEQALKDASIGLLSGITGPLASKLGASVSGKIAGKAMEPVIRPTLSQVSKKAGLIAGGKIAGAAVEGGTNGGLYSGGEYVVNTLTDKNAEFSFNKMTDAISTGTFTGALLNTGLKGIRPAAKDFNKYVSAQKEINSSLAKFNKLKTAGYVKDVDLNDSIAESASLNPNLKGDIDKLYYAYHNNINPQDVFVPRINNTKEAIESLKAGDVCVLENADRISIKMTDGSMQQLNLSPEKYMELFPPMERFALRQQYIGDCYLVSSLHALHSTPNGRAMLLSHFNQKPNGEIEIKIPNTRFYAETSKFINDPLWQGKTIKGAEGIRMLEHSYGESLRYNLLVDDIASHQKYSSAYMEEAERYNFYNYLLNTPNLTFGEIQEKFVKLPNMKNCSPEVQQAELSKYFIQSNNGYVLNNEFIINELKKNTDNLNSLAECMNSLNSAIDKISNDPTHETFLRGLGGFPNEVFRKFGLINTDRRSLKFETQEALSKIKDKNNWDNHIFTIISSGSSDKKFLDANRFITGNHAYFLQPFETETGEILFKVTNPWNTSASNILNEQEILKYFRDIQYTIC